VRFELAEIKASLTAPKCPTCQNCPKCEALKPCPTIVTPTPGKPTPTPVADVSGKDLGSLQSNLKKFLKPVIGTLPLKQGKKIDGRIESS